MREFLGSDEKLSSSSAKPLNLDSPRRPRARVCGCSEGATADEDSSGALEASTFCCVIALFCVFLLLTIDDQ